MTSHNYYLKGADQEDYDFFYTKEEQKEELVVADVLMKNNERLAIGGFFIRPTAALAFVKLKAPIPKKFFLKELIKRFPFAKENLRERIEKELPIYAIRDTTIKNSEAFLKRLGFKFVFLSPNNEEIFKL